MRVVKKMLKKVLERDCMGGCGRKELREEFIRK